jgi:hypothetical protein
VVQAVARDDAHALLDQNRGGSIADHVASMLGGFITRS